MALVFQPFRQQVDKLVDIVPIGVSQSSVFTDFDDTDPWIFQEYVEHFCGLGEAHPFCVRKVGGRQRQLLQDIDIEVQQYRGGRWNPLQCLPRSFPGP